ncbi:unnamed protein product [Moneuplotes crassus]|uniref:Disintegrin domain-containing protein n=1 Tax=Euplotes crassus TaxID=5936 RepID=A0AAD1Y380_EUPCR|nr:unnamed protein product [Moneuplotes crassus]
MEIEPGYSCAGGSISSSDICSTSCEASPGVCYDGNTADDDGCSSTCQVEPGYSCRTIDASYTCLAYCKDGLKKPSEQCDDGQLDIATYPGCNLDCTIAVGYECLGGTPSSADVCNPICGDGIKMPGEGCDDGNKDPADGCSPTCTEETGFSCLGGSPTSADTCSSVCGDSIKTHVEACDDGNGFSNDGCSNTCLIEIGYDCTGGSLTSADTCSSICGDGIKVTPELCDDGNDSPNDGCSNTCLIEIGYDCIGGSLTSADTCSSICGDGIKVTPELCDDGNLDDEDGCNSDCTLIEDDYACIGGSTSGPDTCDIVCGNGILLPSTDPILECDDGNTDNGDGCSENCRVEDNWICTEGSLTSPSVCNLCELDFCTKCESQDHTVCTLCDRGYELDKDSLCTKTTELFMTDDGKRVVSSSQYISMVAVGASFLSSVLKMSSPVAVWAILNQMQLMGLVTLTRVYIPDDPKGMLLGEGSGIPFSLLSLKPAIVPFYNDLDEMMNFNQSAVELEAIGLESGSSLINNVGLIVSIVLYTILHIFIFCMPKCKVKTEKQKCRKFCNASVDSLAKLFTFTIYIRTFIESYQYCLLSAFSAFMRMEFNTMQTKVSVMFSIPMFFCCCCFLQLSLYIVYLLNNEFEKEPKKCKEFLSGVKEKNWARLYCFFGLLRRLLFCSFVIFCVAIGTQLLIVGFLLIQLPYLAYILIIRPLKETKDNLMESINEILLTVIILYLCIVNTPEAWSSILTSTLLYILFAHLIVIALIPTVTCFFASGKIIKKATSKSSVIHVQALQNPGEIRLDLTNAQSGLPSRTSSVLTGSPMQKWPSLKPTELQPTIKFQ